MKTLTKYASLAAILAGTTFAAQAEPVVSTIDVEADFSALGTASTVNFWPTVEADLKAELGERFAGMAGENGVDIDVSVRELSVNAAVSDASYKDLNGIDAVVAVRTDSDATTLTSFRVAYSVLPPDGMTPLPGVIVLQPDSADNYAALIDAVADEIEAKVNDIKM